MEPTKSARKEEVAKRPAEVNALRLVSAGGGEAAFEMEADRRHHEERGPVRGGILMTLADSAMGSAFASTLSPGQSFTTLEAKVAFLRPFFGGRLVAAARVVLRGETVGLLECDVTNGDGKVVAKTWSTCKALRKNAPAGRPKGKRTSPRRESVEEGR